MHTDLLARCQSIVGYMAEDALEWLYDRAAQAKVIVEVGVYQGRSTTALCLGCPGTVYAIDNWMGSPAFPDDTHPMTEKLDVRLAVMSAAFRNLAEFRESGKLVVF